MARSGPLPVWILSGFLGSGKTTTLQHLLDRSPHASAASALLINDFGEINVDATLLSRPGYQLKSVAGGCVCCSTHAEMVGHLRAFAQNPALEIAWIETTGLADPEEVVDHLTSIELQGLIRVHRLLLVVDAAHHPGSWRQRAHIDAQIRYADTLILNKIDLVSAARQEEIRGELEKLNPSADLHACERGRVETSGLWETPGRRIAPENKPQGHASAAVVFLPLEFSVEHSALENFLAGLPENVYRAKGFVRLDTSPGQVHVVQKVAGQKEILLLPLGAETAPPPCGLTLLGPQLDKKNILERFKTLRPAHLSAH
jgi:G3E family GTPase